MVKRAVRRNKRKITRAGAARKPAKMYRTSMRDVPKVAGLKRKDGWVDMQVQFLIEGHGHIYTDDGEAPSGEGDVVYSPRTCWHGFNNTSNADVVLVWGWMGAGSIEASGYEVAPDTH
jgi:cupin domain